MRKMIRIEPFDAPIHVFKGHKSFIKSFPEVADSLEATNGMCAEFKTESGAPCFAMMFPEEYNSEVINHEALHLVHMLLDYHGCGVNETIPNSELQCYLQSHIVREIKKALFKGH